MILHWFNTGRYEQQCSPVMEKKCTTGTEAQCEVVNERKCETVEDEVCEDVPSKQCLVVNDRKCSLVPKQECRVSLKYSNEDSVIDTEDAVCCAIPWCTSSDAVGDGVTLVALYISDL